GFDALTVDLDEHRAALDASVERRAHGLDAGDEHALDAPGHLEAFGGLPIEIAHVEPQHEGVWTALPPLGRLRRRVARVLAIARDPRPRRAGRRPCSRGSRARAPAAAAAPNWRR